VHRFWWPIRTAKIRSDAFSNQQSTILRPSIVVNISRKKTTNQNWSDLNAWLRSIGISTFDTQSELVLRVIVTNTVWPLNRRQKNQSEQWSSKRYTVSLLMFGFRHPIGDGRWNAVEILESSNGNFS
jgi:hypothetical protein